MNVPIHDPLWKWIPHNTSWTSDQAKDFLSDLSPEQEIALISLLESVFEAGAESDRHE